jgi:hypothetical protein
VRYFRSPNFTLPVATPRERRLRIYLRLGACLVLALGVGMALTITRNAGPASVLVQVFMMWALVIGLIIAASRLSMAHYEALAHLRATDFRVCPDCSYDLSASTGPVTCPECGQPHTPESLRQRWTEVYERLTNRPGS